MYLDACMLLNACARSRKLVSWCQWLTCTRKLFSSAEACITFADSGAWTSEATEHFKMHCTKNLDLHVCAPQTEETIDVTIRFMCL